MPRKISRDLAKEKFWRATLGRQKDTGLSQAEFCRRENLSENSFSTWKTIIAERDLEVKNKKEKSALRRAARQADMHPKADTPSFVPLVLAGAERTTMKQQGALVEIRLPGAAVLVFPGADAETLRNVMLAFRECWF